jgi:hypothetical protein
MADLDANMRDLASRYEKPVMVVEAAYPWTLEWCDSTHNPVGMPEHLHDGYPATPEGQATYLSDLLALIEAVPGGEGLAYWEPAHVCTEQGPGTSWENLAFFDFSGNALPSLAFAKMHETSTGPDDEHGELPLRLRVEPNPFHSETVISCALPNGIDTLSFDIYTVSGRLVRTLPGTRSSGGVAKVAWDGRDSGNSPLATGVYFCDVAIAGRKETTTLVLLK